MGNNLSSLYAKFIVNPVAGAGRTGREWPGILDTFRGNGLHFDTNANNNVYRGNTSRGNTVSDFVDSGTGNSSHGDNYMPGQM